MSRSACRHGPIRRAGAASASGSVSGWGALLKGSLAGGPEEGSLGPLKALQSSGNGLPWKAGTLPRGPIRRQADDAPFRSSPLR